MKRLGTVLAVSVIAVASLCALLGPWLAPAPYEHQFRGAVAQPPSSDHLLGTDELGRDRLSRLIYGTRVSLVLAPLAAILATALAALIGGIAGFFGGAVYRLVGIVIDVFLSMPWLFLLITVRAALPLDVAAEVSVIATFVVLGSLGWASAARIIAVRTAELMQKDHVLQARALGIGEARTFWSQIVPNLSPVLLAQLCLCIPVFIVAEANLGVLGLGVAEPMPSWGSMLRELESIVASDHQAWRFVPLAVLVAVVSSFQYLLHRLEVRSC